MIYITGDTHGLVDFQKLKNFAEANPKLTKKDYMIIAGDCGVVWSKTSLTDRIEEYESLPFTVLYVDGNHENFDMLEAYPVEVWNGGNVHRISDNILHLMRGQIFVIEGKTILTFGGAASIDKEEREEGESWWKQEEPNQTELDEAITNLFKVDFNVDYIITHTIDATTLGLYSMGIHTKKKDKTSNTLNYFANNVSYKHWYFGHFHDDKQISYKKTMLYNEIKLVE